MALVSDLLRRGDALPGDSPRRDAEVLLGFCLRKPRSWLYAWPEAAVPGDIEAQFKELLNQRRAGVPVAYLVGRREFWSLSLSVTTDTLIPRPETEMLVTWSLELGLPAEACAVDLGTGSGAIALALATERPCWHICAVDESDTALTVARRNAERLELPAIEFLSGDWFGAVGKRRFNLIVANPPYIDPGDPHLEVGDLRYEPGSALVSDQGGLADLSQLASEAPGYLHSGGWALFEHGCKQGADVRRMLVTAGFKKVQTRTDLAGLERVTGGCWRAQ
ncbi:MAG: peptide chain release factor N(5)-glutamine methyltransferase [Pseudomonadota bacterium]